MTDHFPALAVGELATDRSKAITQDCIVGTVAVAVGDVVSVEHYTLNIPKVVPTLTAKATSILGVVVEHLNNGTGATGDHVLVVLKNAIVKVTAGTGGTTAGLFVGACADAGNVATTSTAANLFAKALHTMNSGDTGLILL